MDGAEQGDVDQVRVGKIESRQIGSGQVRSRRDGAGQGRVRLGITHRLAFTHLYISAMPSRSNDQVSAEGAPGAGLRLVAAQRAMCWEKPAQAAQTDSVSFAVQSN